MELYDNNVIASSNRTEKDKSVAKIIKVQVLKVIITQFAPSLTEINSPGPFTKEAILCQEN